jgi:hypothetical protein
MQSNHDYDAMTGELLPEAAERLQDEATTKAHREAEAVASLTKSDGWQLLKKIMEETIRHETESLLYASAPEYITRAQAIIRARRDLLGWIEMKLTEGRVLLEETKQV